MENVNLTPKDIVNKHFKQKMRGYDSIEVDEFLDDVIQDYETYAKENQRLQMENDRLLKKVDELTKQVAVGKTGTTARPASNASTWIFLNVYPIWNDMFLVHSLTMM